MTAHKYVEEIGSAAMLVTKRSAGVAPEVNLRDASCMPLPGVNNTALYDFEAQMRHHEKFKTGVSVGPQKGLTSFKDFTNKKH